MFRLSISYSIIKYKLSYYARRKEEGIYISSHVCMYILCYQPFTKNVAHKILSLHINGNHSILGMVEKKYLYLQVLPQYKNVQICSSYTIIYITYLFGFYYSNDLKYNVRPITSKCTIIIYRSKSHTVNPKTSGNQYNYKIHAKLIILNRLFPTKFHGNHLAKY